MLAAFRKEGGIIPQILKERKENEMKTENLIIGDMYEDLGSKLPEPGNFIKYVEKWGEDSFKFDRIHSAKGSIVLTSELVESRIKEIE